MDTRQAYFYGFPTYMVENEGDVLVPAESVEGGVGRGEYGQVSVQVVLVDPAFILQQFSKRNVKS